MQHMYKPTGLRFDFLVTGLAGSGYQDSNSIDDCSKIDTTKKSAVITFHALRTLSEGLSRCRVLCRTPETSSSPYLSRECSNFIERAVCLHTTHYATRNNYAYWEGPLSPLKAALSARGFNSFRSRKLISSNRGMSIPVPWVLCSHIKAIES